MSKKQDRKHIIVDKKTHTEVKMIAARDGTTLGAVIQKLLVVFNNV